MKKSLNAWSVPGKVGFDEMFEAVKAAGFDGIELNIDKEDSSAHSLALNMSSGKLMEIKGYSEKHELPISGISTSLGGQIGSGDPKVRETQKDLILKQIQFAKLLGAEGVLSVVGGMGEGVSLLAAHENALKAYSEIIPDIKQEGIDVGVENVWNGFFSSPFHMNQFIDELACEYLGAYYDIGNSVEFSTTQYWIEILGERIKMVHVKDFRRAGGHQHSGGCFVNLLQGSIDWAEVMKSLRLVGYNGYLTAELDVIWQCPEYLYEITSRALDIIVKL